MIRTPVPRPVASLTRTLSTVRAPKPRRGPAKENSINISKECILGSSILLLGSLLGFTVKWQNTNSKIDPFYCTETQKSIALLSCQFVSTIS